jgi:hypothetical protein
MQASALAMTVVSGSQASGRPPPFRPRLPCRGLFRLVFSAWLGFCPFDGGKLELSGVFGGSASFASNSANPTLCRVQPLPQRQDQRILLGVAQLAEVGQYAHAKLESSCP